MARRKKKNPRKELLKILNNKFTPGVCKLESNPNNIRSYGTFKVYLQQGERFIAYCQKYHSEDNFKKMAQYIPEYIMFMKNTEWLSNRTIKTARAAKAEILNFL